MAAAGASQTAILTAGIAGLVSGAASMAAGEYVSVSTQADTERADLDRERQELATEPEREHAEMAAIYGQRGLDGETAARVATQLMAHDALGAHARDELGISDVHAARPFQAAATSAACFAGGALLPLLVVAMAPAVMRLWLVTGSSLLFLAGSGWLAARVGGAPVIAAATRMSLWGGLAMALTAGAGALVGAVV